MSFDLTLYSSCKFCRDLAPIYEEIARTAVISAKYLEVKAPLNARYSRSRASIRCPYCCHLQRWKENQKTIVGFSCNYFKRGAIKNYLQGGNPT